MSFCRSHSVLIDSSSPSQAKDSACPFSSLPSMAMNFITAVSSTSTESQLSGNIGMFETSNTKVSEETTTLTRVETSSTSAPASPKARSRRRSWQSKTSYHLAHPPPSTTLRRRFKLRPRIILQLQQVSGTLRPIPVLDVFPSVLFAPRLARKAPSILQHKHGLGLDDLVIVQSPDRVPDIAPQTESSGYRDGEKATGTTIIAAICRSHPTERNGQCRTEIRFNHDDTWTATALSNGAYEFVSNGYGETQSIARWLPKREAGKGESAGKGVQNFKFSLIDAKSRRHPVIANMNRQSIDIYDRYSIPSSPQHSCRHTDAGSIGSVESVEMEHNIDAKYGECDEPCRKVIETDDPLRTMIAITGIWVGFCEGWSPNFKYSTTQARRLTHVFAPFYTFISLPQLANRDPTADGFDDFDAFRGLSKSYGLPNESDYVGLRERYRA
ncbi:MAG: hypothetical protein Q9181_005018 [Wetmoreana brouardii]